MITEATIEADPAKNCDFKIGRRFGKWRVTNKLDEGGFGQVYRVENIYRKGEFAALKAEPNDVEGGSAIKLEIMILQFLNKGGDKPHVMKVYHAAKHRRFCYMIVTLLGENLRTLKLNCPDERMSISTWSRIGIQCLYSIKLLHDVGFVHRDIKPANFVMGDEHDVDRARCVHILDFGLARNFAFERKKGLWAARRARGSAEFRGTMRYCSPTVHDKKEQGRKDDVWSLMYMLIELHCGLPWQKEKDKKRLEMMKMNMSDKDLLKNFPAEMHPVLPHLRTLNCYSRPNYTMIHKCFLRLMKRLDIKYNDKYDWETDAQVEELVRWFDVLTENYFCGIPHWWPMLQFVLQIKRRTKVPEYEHSEEFFASDPIKVHGAPPKWLDTKGGRTVEDLEEMMSKPMEVDRTRSSSKNSRRKTVTKK